MRGIILAAGKGSRMGQYTKKCPKGLLKIGGKEILKYTIDNFRSVGINDITILTGYQSKKIAFRGVNYIQNKDYMNTNMVYTFFCAKSLMNSNIIVSYGDIVYEPKILQKVLIDKSDISVAIDDNWHNLWSIRTNHPLKDAETLTLDKNDYITSIGKKPKNLNEIESQYIGLLKIKEAVLGQIIQIYELIKHKNENQIVINNRNYKHLHMTDLLQIIINNGIKIKGVRIKGGWLEFDTISDYDIYTTMYKERTLSRYCDIDIML